MDAVIHLAALVAGWGPYAAFYRTNVVGTERVLAACRAHGVAKLVYTSTPSVVHDGGDAAGIDESEPYATRFLAHYPATKAIAERAVLRTNSSSLATVALRPHLVWGPGDNHLLPRAVARAKAGRLRLPGGPPCLVDSTYIDDAARAHLLALDRLVPGAACAGRAYFISQGEPLPVRELVNKVLVAAGVPEVRKTVSPRAMQALGWAAEIVHAVLRRPGEPLLTRFAARQLTTAHWYDIGAARRDLGFEPSVTIDEGLGRLTAWLAAAAPPPGDRHAHAASPC
jgi:nucleoside-diphosphate-sugar epimerase